MMGCMWPKLCMPNWPPWSDGTPEKRLAASDPPLVRRNLPSSTAHALLWQRTEQWVWKALLAGAIRPGTQRMKDMIDSGAANLSG